MTVTPQGGQDPAYFSLFSTYRPASAMDPLARRVAARWGLQVAMQGYNPPIPAWVFEWAEGTVKTARGVCPDIKPFPCPHCGKMILYPPQPLTDAETVAIARDSVAGMLPKFLDLLHHKFNERFFMNSSASSTRIHYYFATKNPLETIAVMIGIVSQKIFLSMMYAPVNLQGAVDYKGATEMRENVEDPELAGLALMRLGRNVLARV